MGNLMIRKLKYIGDEYYYESPVLKDGLNIIKGNNGSGKTTFCDLIYFALGGNPDKFNKRKTEIHKEIMNNDSNNYVELTIEINKQTFKIKRLIDNLNCSNSLSVSNKIFVANNNEQVVNYPISRRYHDGEIFSD